MRQQTQKQNILNHLKEGYGITPIDALEKFGCFRLAAVIFNLKKDGYDIKTTIRKMGNKKFAIYGLKNHTSWN
jgi:hypothetical protein